MSKRLYDREYYENLPYSDFMEILKTEIGDMLRMMESGKVVRYQALKARQKSIRVRNLLKSYRVVSIRHDDYVSEVTKKMKDQLNNS